MTTRIEAVYEEGVFRPRDPVDLTDGTVVELMVHTRGGTLRSGATPDEVNRDLDEIAALYNPSGPEGAFSGADHDEVLYGVRGAA